MNNTILMGRLVADPELRRTNSGTAVCSFTLAVNRFAKAGEKPEADFFDMVAWGKTAEFVCKYFTKGQQMAVQGRLQTRSYEDRNGQKRKVVEVVAEDVYFTESKKQQQAADPFAGDFTEADPGDDLPF
jgi:single-strand DNA-binding protein